jgi:membrane-bound ClpP family serine protease
MTSLGVALLVVGAVVGAAEVHYPSHGIAGGAGVLAMAVGAVLLISGLGAGVLLGLLAGLLLAGAGAGALVFSLGKGLEARQRRVSTGAEGLIGHVGVVRSWTSGTGSVALDGAVWQARRSAADDDEDRSELHAGDPIVVERLNGLTLSVRPAEEWELL